MKFRLFALLALALTVTGCTTPAGPDSALLKETQDIAIDAQAYAIQSAEEARKAAASAARAAETARKARDEVDAIRALLGPEEIIELEGYEM